jgi:hypothetical protein
MDLQGKLKDLSSQTRHSSALAIASVAAVLFGLRSMLSSPLKSTPTPTEKASELASSTGPFLFFPFDGNPTQPARIRTMTVLRQIAEQINAHEQFSSMR